jgi:hypothetical protein
VYTTVEAVDRFLARLSAPAGCVVTDVQAHRAAERQLEAAGILGGFEGSKARRVMVPNEAALDALLNPAGAPAGPGMGGF